MRPPLAKRTCLSAPRATNLTPAVQSRRSKEELPSSVDSALILRASRLRITFSAHHAVLPACQLYLPLRATGDESAARRPHTQPASAAAKPRCTLPLKPRWFSASAIWEYTSIGTASSASRSPSGLAPPRHERQTHRQLLPAHTAVPCRSKDALHSPVKATPILRAVFGNHSVGKPRGAPCPSTGLASSRHG